jgi:RNA polymerase sigma-70 factor (ECF subfamily)
MGTFVNTIKSKTNKKTETDNVLVERFVNGDKNAFNQLVSKYEKSVYRIAYRFFYDEEEAMDATQEIFLKVYKSLHKFEKRSSFKTWIYRIASNTCITISEKRKKGKEGLFKTIMNWWSDRNIETPEEEVLAKESSQITQKMVVEKLSQLPAKYRMPVILKDIEGLPLEKICEVLDIPLGTVKSRINRGRRLLQNSLQAYYYGRAS